MPCHALRAATLLISACAQQKHQGQEPIRGGSGAPLRIVALVP